MVTSWASVKRFRSGETVSDGVGLKYHVAKTQWPGVAETTMPALDMRKRLVDGSGLGG